MARLDRLGLALEVAQIESVIGRGFSYSLLRAVAGLEGAPLQASTSQNIKASSRSTLNTTSVTTHAASDCPTRSIRTRSALN